MNLKIKKMHNNAVIPQRATDGSAGFDLCACIDSDIVIAPNEIKKIPVGVAISSDKKDIALLIFARSGLASKYGIAPVNCVGVVDSDYRGEIVVALINHGTENFTVTPQMRIAQLVAVPIIIPTITVTDTLDDTERGNNGFGSTGC